VISWYAIPFFGALLGAVVPAFTQTWRTFFVSVVAFATLTTINMWLAFREPFEGPEGFGVMFYFLALFGLFALSLLMRMAIEAAARLWKFTTRAGSSGAERETVDVVTGEQA
jgi:hypothetical protein